MGFDHFWPCLQLQTTVHLSRLEFVQVLEMLVGQGLVGEWPQLFGRARGQKVQVYPRRHPVLRAHMPPRGVEHEEDLLALPCANCLGTLSEGDRKGWNGHGGELQPPSLARLRMQKGVEITPLVAMPHDCLWALPARAPVAAQDGLEPDAVLVGGPQLHRLLQVGPLGMHAVAQPDGHPSGGFGPVQTPPFGGGCLRAAASAARWLVESSLMRPGVRCRRSSSPAGRC
jgi:hypothetical protein